MANHSIDSSRSPWRLLTLLLVLGLAPGASAQARPRHVLLLYSYEREFTHTAFAGMFRPELTQSSPEPIDYIEVALQTAGESLRAPDDSIVSRLGSTFAGTRLDLVVAIGGPLRRHSTVARLSRRSTASAGMTANTDGFWTLAYPDLHGRPSRGT